MTMNIDSIVDDVALLLNLPPPSFTSPDTPFSSAFRRRILLDLEECAAKALSSLPPETPLPVKPFPQSSLISHSDNEYRLPLPDDFLCLRSLRMSDWTVDSLHTFPADHWLLRFQSSGIETLAAASDRPLVFLDSSPDGKGSLRIFGSGPGASVAEGFYLPRPRINEAGEIDIPPAAYRALLAELVTACFGPSSEQALCISHTDR